MKRIEEYIQYYLDCKVLEDGGNVGELLGIYKLESGEKRWFVNCSSNQPYWTRPSNCKLLLRQLSDITEEDFYSWFERRDSDVLVMGKINDYWCAGYYDTDEYKERMEEGLSVDPIDLLTDLDEADCLNVFTCNKSGHLAYGLSEEMRFFIDLPTVANFHNHLRKRGIDCDNLIPECLALNIKDYQP